MGNNILDKPAMQTLAKLDTLIPTLPTKDDFHRLEIRMTMVESAVNSEPMRCPYREDVSRNRSHDDDIEDLKKAVGKNSSDIASTKTQVKVLSGINTTISAAIAAVLAWAKGTQ